jgi:hypothetical protein
VVAVVGNLSSSENARTLDAGKAACSEMVTEAEVVQAFRWAGRDAYCSHILYYSLSEMEAADSPEAPDP